MSSTSYGTPYNGWRVDGREIDIGANCVFIESVLDFGADLGQMDSTDSPDPVPLQSRASS